MPSNARYWYGQAGKPVAAKRLPTNGGDRDGLTLGCTR